MSTKFDQGQAFREDLAKAWTEREGFFPWIINTETLGLLSEAIDIDLQPEPQTLASGPTYADFVAKESMTNKRVVLAAQLSRTDQLRLGQILAYGAAYRPIAIVWAATPFSEEQQAVFRWLNKITSKTNFFGLEVELLQISESLPAPRFKPVCWPIREEARVEARSKARAVEGVEDLQGGDLAKSKQL